MQTLVSISTWVNISILPDFNQPATPQCLLTRAFLCVHVPLRKCWGGHGRTGTVLCVLLGAIYPHLSEVEILNICQSLHGAREYNPHHRSPEEAHQKEFVIKMIQRVRMIQQQGRGRGGDGMKWQPAKPFSIARLSYAPYKPTTEPTTDATRMSARARVAARAAAALAEPDSPPRAGAGSGTIIVDSFGTASTTHAMSTVPSTPLRTPSSQRRISGEEEKLQLSPTAQGALASAGGASSPHAGQLVRREMIAVDDCCDGTNLLLSANPALAPAASIVPPSFTLLTFNTLAKALCDTVAFPHTDPSVLPWHFRRSMLVDEITGGFRSSGFPDVACLQEVDESTWTEWFSPQLASRGYSQTYYMKKCGDGLDGLGVAVRDGSFRVERIQRTRIAPNQGQVVLLLQLEPVLPSTLSSSPRSNRRLYVAATHLKAKDGFELIRLKQAHLILLHLQQFISRYHGVPILSEGEVEELSSEGHNPPHASQHFQLPADAAVIFAGDFNDTPDSPVYRFVAEGNYTPIASTPIVTQSPQPHNAGTFSPVIPTAAAGNATAAAASTSTASSNISHNNNNSNNNTSTVEEPPTKKRQGLFSAIFGSDSNTVNSPSPIPPMAPSALLTSSNDPALLVGPPLTHSLWLHSLYNRLWRSGDENHNKRNSNSSSSGNVGLNHMGPLYTTSKRRAILVQRCIDYIFFSPHALRPTALLSIPQREQTLPAFLPAERYPSDHLAIAGTFEWK
jgi:mRNA deadenylase 3'-5' endonuclease subunit Ccr4